MNDKELKHRLQAIESAIKALEFRAPRQENNASVSPESNTQIESQSAPREIPVVSPPPSYPKYPKQSTEEPVPWWQLWRYPKERLEKMGIMAGIFYAVITYWQWRDLRRNFEVGQRAWVLVERAPIITDGTVNEPDITKIPSAPLVINTPQSILVAFKNSGMSPALKIHVRVNGAISASSKGCSLIALPPDSIDSTSVLGPGHVAWSTGLKIIVRPDCFDAINRGAAIVKMTGIIDYEDIFNHGHTTDFCLQYDAPKALGMADCKEGNDAN